MRLKNLLFILIVNSLFSNAINLAVYLILGENLLSNWDAVVLSGLVVFGLQGILIHILVKSFPGKLFPRQMFGKSMLLNALLAAATILIITQVWTKYATGAPTIIPSQKKTVLYLLIFLLNSIPAAFLEEILFRHLPITYGDNKHYSPQQLTLLAVGITLIFSISHISAYMVRDHIPFTGLSQPLLGAFFYGLSYFLIYAVTRNIYLVTFIHAFSNNPLYLVDSPYRATFYFYSYIFVIIIWLMQREVRKRIS